MASEDIVDVLNAIWQTISAAYDVTAGLPEIQHLFAGVDLSTPRKGAETILVNMLAEAMESVGRFSPWYRKSADAFGLTLVRDPATDCIGWRLEVGMVHRWQRLLDSLASALEKNVGLILSASLLDELERQASAEDLCVAASCLCTPPRIILVNRSVLVGAEIKCDACQHPVQPIEDTPVSDQ